MEKNTNELVNEENSLTKYVSYKEFLRRLYFVKLVLDLRNKRYLKNNNNIHDEVIEYVPVKIVDDKLVYFISPLIAIFLLLIIYLLKGIYPFGEKSIIWGDLGQSTVKLYYHIYDVLHGTKSFFYNFNVSGGSNMYGINTFMGLLSPISWIVALFPREKIVHVISYLLIIRCALSALTTIVFFKKVFPSMASHITIALSLMYAFSSYNITQYTNMMWLDIVIWFPLLLLSLKTMLDTHILKWYIIVLTICLVSCFYISFMILLFIFFSSIVYIYCYLSYCKLKRALSVFYLCLGTLTSLLISAVILVPSYLQIKQSSRAVSFRYKTIVETLNGPMPHKLLFFIFTALPIIMLIILIHTYNKYKKFVWFIFLSLFLTIIQVFIESINLLWHTGSYIAFPYRYGFIPIFIILIACGFVLMNENTPILPVFLNRTHWDINSSLFMTLALVPMIYALLLTMRYYPDINKSIDTVGINNTLIIKLFFIFLLFAFSYRIILFFQNNKVFPIMLLSFIIIELFAHGILFIGVPSENVGIERKDVYFKIEEAIKNESIKDPLIRIKDRDRLMSDNYPLVIDEPSLSGWIHIVSPEEQRSLNKLGYTSLFTRTIDTGGTVFSDTLLGIGRVISRFSINPSITTLVKDATIPTEQKDLYENVYLYDYNYKLPFCKIVPNKFKEFSIIDNISAIENQNNLYASLTGDMKPLFKNTNVNNIKNTGVNLSFDVDIKEKTILYFDVMDQRTPFNIYINGEALSLPFLVNRENTYYPQGWRNGLIEIGVFENQLVNIIVTNPKISPLNSIYCLNINEYKEFIEQFNMPNIEFSYKGSSMSVLLNNDENNKSVFLPITYDKGWKCKLNGENVPIYKACGYFMMVDLKQGDNILKFTFTPPYFYPSLAISIGTLTLVLIIYIVNKKKPIKIRDYLVFGTYYTYHFLYIIGFIFVYLIPVLYILYSFIKKVD